MNQQTFLTEVRAHIASAELPEALQKLRAVLEHTPQLNEIIQQSGRLAQIKRQIRLGLTSHEEATVTQNQIRYGVLELLKEIEEKGIPEAALKGLFGAVEESSTQAVVQDEINKAISIVNSKNVLIGSTINAGGNVHIGDVVHQTVVAESASLERPLNQHLTKILIEAIQPHSIAAQRFLVRVKNHPNWENIPEAANKAKEILAYSFVGVIGIQLSKLFAIGNEPFSEKTQSKYIGKCLDILRRSQDLLIFSMLSQLWEGQKKGSFSLQDAPKDRLRDFFDRMYEPSLSEQYTFLKQLYSLFPKGKTPFFIRELDHFAPHFETGSTFQNAISKVQEISARFSKNDCTAADCIAAENALTEVLKALHFLAAYQMASIKRIGFWQNRSAAPRYLHRFTALGIDSKANVDAEKIDFTADTADTDSVLLYHGDRYQSGINLCPFVIDYNALTFESGAKICFFQAKALDSDSLSYRFLEDNSLVNIDWEGLMQPESDPNKVLFAKENQITYKLDNVIAQFRDARNCILGEELLFDDL